ncbi:MAG: type III polyketide synthase [Candidatus Dormibacteraceae bacterium]
MVTAPGHATDRPSALLGLGTALPPHELTPERAREILVDLFPRLGRADLPPLTRYTVLPVETGGRTLGEAMEAYRVHAPRLAAEASQRALEEAGVAAPDVDAVVTASCTGYLVPSLDVHLIRLLGLRRDVRRIPLTELGCSGGLAALGIGHELLQARPEGCVLVAAVELPSLNLQPRDRSLDNLTATIVFGDGAGAAVLGGGRPPAGRLQVDRVATRLVPESTRHLGFDLRDDGFHTVLDPGLARLLERGLGEVVDSFWPGARPAFSAVHAGGLRIFDAVEKALGLDPRALQPSRDVFLRTGNLSSASILFVLEQIARSEAAGEGLALAFGPGVTVELARLSRAS